MGWGAEKSTFVIQETRLWIPGRARYAVLLPVLAAFGGLLALADSLELLFIGGPIFGLMIFGGLAMFWGKTFVKVDAVGFRLRPRPRGVGLAETVVRWPDVVAVFPRALVRGVSERSFEWQYWAAVELRNGKWVNVRGHYQHVREAIAACGELALQSGLTVGDVREGVGPKGDWGWLRVTGLWLFAYAMAMAWAVWNVTKS